MSSPAERRRERYLNRSRNSSFNQGFEAVYDPYGAQQQQQRQQQQQPHSPVEDDEALARALQEEFQAEFSRTTATERSFSDRAVPPTTNLSPQVTDEEYARRLQQSFQTSSAPLSSRSSRSSPPSLRSNTTSSFRTGSTAAIAPTTTTSSRELPSAQNPSYRSKKQQQQQQQQQQQYLATPSTSRSSSFQDQQVSKQMQAADDEELARRVTQELQDEELARNLEKQDEERRSRLMATSVLQASSRHAAAAETPRSRCRRWCCYFIPLSIIAASAAAILYYLVYGPENLAGKWSGQEFVNEDPFAQQSPNETNRWPNDGHGLELHVLNALDSDWYPYFYTAVAEWDNGSPDTLTLKSTQINPDATCKTVARTLKVCNGNYGETSWRGINKLLLEDTSIYASAARMNEYYFGNNDEDQRQYTMCHELGHGWGLPHTDESFTNADLGNCMDYTNRPHINRQPALVNFLFLEQLYGVVAGSQVTVSSNAMGDQDEMKSVFAGTKDEQDKVTAAEQDTNKNDDNDNDNDTPVEFTDAQDEKDQDNEEEDDKKEDDKKKEDKKKNKKKDDRRHLRSSTADAITSHYHPDDHPMVPHRVLRSLESVEEEIENGLWTAENGWNVLHRGEHGEAHEKHLGDGFRVQIHLLLAYEDE